MCFFEGGVGCDVHVVAWCGVVWKKKAWGRDSHDRPPPYSDKVYYCCEGSACWSAARVPGVSAARVPGSGCVAVMNLCLCATANTVLFDNWIRALCFQRF